MTEKYLALIIYFLCTASSWLVIRRFNRGSYLLYSAPVVFFWLHLAMIQTGALLYAADYQLLVHILEYENIEWTQFLYSIYMSLGLLFFAIGVSACSLIFGFDARREIVAFQSKQILFSCRSFSRILAFFGAVISCLLVGGYYYSKGTIPILDATASLFSSDLRGDLSAMRAENSYENAMPGSLLQVVRVIFPYIILCLFFWDKFYPSGSRLVRLTKYPLVFLSFLFLAANGERMPLAAVVMAWIIVENFSDQSRYSVGGKLVKGVILFAAFLILSFLLGRSASGGDLADTLNLLFESLVYRVFLSQSQTGSYIFQLYQSDLSFRGFDIYIQNFGTYFPGRDRSFSVDLFYIVHGRAGSASHSALAEAYAGFSGFGVLCISFFLGILLQWTTIRLVRGKKEIARLVFFSFVVLTLSMVSLGSITGIFYAGLVSAVLVYQLQRFFAYQFCQKEPIRLPLLVTGVTRSGSRRN